MTMRRLAATLGVNPMSIYHHLPNKAAVFAGLAELVFAGLELPDPGDAVPWQDAIEGRRPGLPQRLRAHPNLALQVLSDTSAVSEVVVVTVEPFYRALDRAGLSPRQIFESVNTLIDFIHGFSLGEARSAPRPSTSRPTCSTRVEGLPAGQGSDADPRRPGTRPGRPCTTTSTAGFESGLTVLTAGIAAAGRRR